MPIRTVHTTLAAALLASSVGCNDKSTAGEASSTLEDESCRGVGDCGSTTAEQGGSGSDDTGTAGDSSDGEPDDTGLDRCDCIGFDLCFDFAGFDQTQSWCEELSAIYGIYTAYDPSACPGGAVGVCDLTNTGGEFPTDTDGVYGFFYADTYSPETAESVCIDSGGEPL